MKKIEIPQVIAKMTVEEAQYINDLISRDTIQDGKQTNADNENYCGVCGTPFGEGTNFCPHCGQRVRFVKLDVIPFEDMRAE